MDQTVKLIYNGECANYDYKEDRKTFLDSWKNNEHLTSMKDNIKRITTLRKCSHEKIISILENLQKNPYYKDSALASLLRSKGNDYYKTKNLKAALRGYNLSLCFSPQDYGEEMSLAYANRSACFLELNRFEDALKDIEMSFNAASNIDSNDGNSNLKRKLMERKEKCLQRMSNANVKQSSKAKFVGFQLKIINELVESAAEFVTIADETARGRHVRVTEDVVPGTILIVEEPFAKILVKQLLFHMDRCDHCQKKLSGNGFSCPFCVFGVYCNDICRNENLDIHQYECAIFPHLHKMGVSRLLLLSFRIITKLGPEKLYKFWKCHCVPNSQSQSHLRNEKRILGFNSDGKYDSSDYLTIYNLIYHDDALTERELCQYCLESILIVNLLNNHTQYFNVPKYDDEKDREDFLNFAASVLLLHQMNLPCNAHSLNELQLENYENPTKDEIKIGSTSDYGAGAFSLLSLINHSCDPNVTRVTLANGQNAVIAIRIIKAGDEVLDNYGAHYAVEESALRKKHLKSQYNFDCTCVACEFKWPTVLRLNNNNNTFTCLSCRENLSLQTSYAKIISCRISSQGVCSQCTKSYDTKLLETKLDSYIEKFDASYELVLNNRGEESINDLQSCLLYFETQMLPPFIYTNYSQETIKQAFNLINLSL